VILQKKDIEDRQAIYMPIPDLVIGAWIVDGNVYTLDDRVNVLEVSEWETDDDCVKLVRTYTWPSPTGNFTGTSGWPSMYDRKIAYYDPLQGMIIVFDCGGKTWNSWSFPPSSMPFSLLGAVTPASSTTVLLTGFIHDDLKIVETCQDGSLNVWTFKVGHGEWETRLEPLLQNLAEHAICSQIAGYPSIVGRDLNIPLRLTNSVESISTILLLKFNLDSRTFSYCTWTLDSFGSSLWADDKGYSIMTFYGSYSDYQLDGELRFSGTAYGGWVLTDRDERRWLERGFAASSD
jgi:hypothetical protein